MPHCNALSQEQKESKFNVMKGRAYAKAIDALKGMCVRWQLLWLAAIRRLAAAICATTCHNLHTLPPAPTATPQLFLL